MYKRDLVCETQNCKNKQWAKGLCSNHYQKSRRNEDPENAKKAYQATKRWRAKHPEKLAETQRIQHERHKVKINAYTAQWKRDNWGTYKSYLAARKNRLKQATPKWENLKEIEWIYRHCPKGYHVDHIIPLNGKNVCGLNCVENLQYLTAAENLRKSNK